MTRRAGSTTRIPAGDPLLAGTTSDAERRARRRLVRELLEAGLSADELLRAVAEDRLALLPAEVVLAGRRRYTSATLERRTGLTRAQFDQFMRASGVSINEELTSGELVTARCLSGILEAGVPFDGLLEVARVAGQGLAATARAMLRVVGDSYIRPGDSEYELGARYAQVAAELIPVLGPLLDQQLRIHIREALRQETIARDERMTGHIEAARHVGVAFADLVGFTRMGTRVHADEVGRVAGRLNELAIETVRPPVTIVKTIGDAVMLVSPDPGRLVEDVLTLIAGVERQGADFPELRAGVAFGAAVPLGGDWYGHSVNLASRITAAARPGKLLATSEVRNMTRDRFSWSRTMPKHIRGVRGWVFVASVDGGRVRPAARPQDGGDEGPGS